MSEQNPYASPPIARPVPPPVDSKDEAFLFSLDNRDKEKSKAVIQDAENVLLVLFIGIVCFWISVLIVPVYLFRLLQWSRLAKKYPELLPLDVPPTSGQARFKAVERKLVIGFAVSGVVSAGLLLAAVFSIFVSYS